MLRTRREILTTLGLGLAGAAVLSRAGGAGALKGLGGRPSPAAQPVGASGSAAAGEGGATAFAPGTALGPCTVVRVAGLEDGAIPIILASADGRKCEVDVMRFDPKVPGIARAGSMAIYLANNGDGEKPSDEAHGLGALALAAELARREASGAKVPALKTITERGNPRKAKAAIA